MFNSFFDHEINISIFYHFSTLGSHKEFVILRCSHSYCQYHRCWWPGDARSLGISSNILALLLEYSGFSTTRVLIVKTFSSIDYLIDDDDDDDDDDGNYHHQHHHHHHHHHHHYHSVGEIHLTSIWSECISRLRKFIQFNCFLSVFLFISENDNGDNINKKNIVAFVLGIKTASCWLLKQQRFKDRLAAWALHRGISLLYSREKCRSRAVLADPRTWSTWVCLQCSGAFVDITYVTESRSRYDGLRAGASESSRFICIRHLAGISVSCCRLSTLRPVANELLNDALRLDNELSALAATCSLRSVSKVQINKTY